MQSIPSPTNSHHHNIGIQRQHKDTYFALPLASTPAQNAVAAQYSAAPPLQPVSGSMPPLSALSQRPIIERLAISAPDNLVSSASIHNDAVSFFSAPKPPFLNISFYFE